MKKKLSIAFVWHMHQPDYKDRQTGEYIMPWVRLHAIKDYLDMVLILEEFPKIRQTINIVPLLIDQLEDYALNNAHDVHSRLTVTDIAKLTEKDKQYILNHFFDANYPNMILPHESYNTLYEKRYHFNEISVDLFSDQEYSDIMAWFNLAWFDPCWINYYPELKKLYEKETRYTLDDRKQIIDIQRDIIKKIIPTYKKFFDEGKIEISTSPYYHPIIPLLIDITSAKRAVPNIELPGSKYEFIEDAQQHLKKAINKFKDIFGREPNGIWPTEHCVSPKTLKMFSDNDIKWTITDEGVLAKTLKKEFIKDFRGIIEDPYELSNVYSFKTNKKEINVLFRDSVIANLIGFEYGNHDPDAAANDLYERIKTIQSKLVNSPEQNHLITIALDGENCWESYYQDGRPFLSQLYTMLSEDDSLDVCTISEYIEKIKVKKYLDTIYSGSWINRNFQLWVGDPIKNLAWDYLHQTRQDLVKFTSETEYPKGILEQAWNEIYIAQGSDWFWWYGEPNDSGQDDLFDKLFRSHLQSVYDLLEKPVPNYLLIPLEVFIGKPSKNPKDLISPIINGKDDSEDEWVNAGCIEIPSGPMYKADRLFDRIYFGNDHENLYFKFDISNFHLQKSSTDVNTNEIYFYFQNPKNLEFISHISPKTTSETLPQVIKTPFSHELFISFNHGFVLPPILSEATENFLWKVNLAHKIKYYYEDVLEISIPFNDLNVERGQDVHFLILIAKSCVIQEIIPQNQTLVIYRPE
jgi:alpha-amylase/alpha-mannosidase (GH57 family)